MYVICNPRHKLYYYSFLWYRVEYKRKVEECRIFASAQVAQNLIQYILETSEKKGKNIHNLIVIPYPVKT